ncbi:MAG: hypothetical protein JWP01_2056 [Myxococcales bacterium]|nr:hypothetical protein [Myxococcales bacterium]
MSRSMSAASLVLGLLVSLTTACKSGASEPPAPPRFTGPVTAERVVKAGAIADQDDLSWTRAVALIEAEAGAPITSNGDLRSWGVVENDTCTYLEIEKSKKRDAVGSVSKQPLIKKADFEGGGGNYAVCVAKVQAK